ncbi:Frag1/DRAM/Sfk1 family-domain-containing protein [Cristinia sonorae]|uniref:Frag1/DRAM/Sfk1 family-domain-containing protein n=1 Tax=Cristinia sonorae TaxID=1940300 RepID=A0A8K0UPQ7_9AGAR|nr:Frag1/DRAM/Sfk1 family-domain-containing protein [Cristinia sonorae]
MPHSHQHWLYVWIPLVGAVVWFATLLALLVTWLAQGRPKYVSQEGSITYISDVGADILKPLFIVGCVITGVSFFLALSIERWLRHSGRLVPNMRTRERVFSVLAILASFVGGAGLILLSIFDTKRHPSIHRLFLLIFILGVGLSAIFTVIEYRWISHDFYEIRKLKIAYRVKGTIATLLILLAVAFAVALYQAKNVGAVLEWVIAFGYTFYLLTFFYDLRMAKGVRKGEMDRDRLLAMQGGEGMREARREVNETGRTYPVGEGQPGGVNGFNGHANGVHAAGNDRAANRRWW